MSEVKLPDIARLVPRLNYSVKHKHCRLKNFDGPKGRIKYIQNLLSALFKYERIEALVQPCTEVRGYAERLISEAVRNGDCHEPTMDMANFWLHDKQMIHKLFKVLAPRFQDYKKTYTEMYLLPLPYHLSHGREKVMFLPLHLLELRGNPYPPIPKKLPPNSQSLTNILLREASKEYRKEKLTTQKTDS